VNIRRFAMAAAIAGVMLSAGSVAAKQAGGGPPQTPVQPGVGQTSAVTLKVTVTISRWDAEKKVSSSPYVLMVVPSYGKYAEVGQDGEQTVIQMGSETPVPATTMTEGKTVSTYQYKNIGTNISVAARPVDDGRFNVSVGVQDSQLGAPQTVAGGTAARYLTFRSNNRLTMRDGQTIQYAVATDTVSGQVVKLDVTMNVVK
jgi:hypothetical protein